MTQAALELAKVSRDFGGVPAVDRCDLLVGDGEIVALLGPSGCGKSTLLNMIAGFETPDAGTIRLRGALLNPIPPHRRNIAMVFQQYAVFPHLTVARNIAYGLHARGQPHTARRDRVAEMVTLLKLDGLEDRYPAQLSGGQRQRVAIARALAIQPAVLLLDEAFSALDRNLREAMQLELSLLLRRLRATAILVTHDQREAFALADRVAVMRAGRIVQIGTPREMYDTPADSYVLNFLGTTNALPGEVVDGRVHLAPGCSFPTTSAASRTMVHLRAEDIRLSPAPTAVHAACPAVVALATFLGAQERIVVTLQDQQVVIERPGASRFGASHAVAAGNAMFLDFDPLACRLSPVH